MAVREAMDELIAELRLLVNDNPIGPSGETLVTKQIFSDQQIQDALDKYANQAMYEPLTAVEKIQPGGVVEYKKFKSEHKNWDKEAVITDGNYAVVTPIVSTFDLGIWLFSTSQSLPLLIYGAWYDSYAAAADVWELKAAIYAGHTDFSADGGNYSDSQLYDMAVKQAQKYRNMSCHGAVLTHLKRTDVRP